MSNDTTYRLQFRHPNKARLEAVRTFVTVVKPALCQFVQNMKFDPEWSAEKCLNLLGIRNLSEVITWFRMGENLSDLGVDPRKAATKLSKKDREWLRWQKFPVEP